MAINGYFILMPEQDSYEKNINVTWYLNIGECVYERSHKVGMANSKRLRPDVITTLGLGSRIGLVLYDPRQKWEAWCIICFPDSTKVRNTLNIAKFGDTGIRELLKRVVAAGASKPRLIAKIAGARMFDARISDGKYRSEECGGCQSDFKRTWNPAGSGRYRTQLW